MKKSSPKAGRGLVMIEVLVAAAVAGALVSGLFEIVRDYASLAFRGAAVLDATRIAHRVSTHLDTQRKTGRVSGYSWHLARGHSPVSRDEIRGGFRLVTEEITVVGPGLSSPIIYRRERLVQ